MKKIGLLLACLLMIFIFSSCTHEYTNPYRSFNDLAKVESEVQCDYVTIGTIGIVHNHELIRYRDVLNAKDYSIREINRIDNIAYILFDLEMKFAVLKYDMDNYSYKLSNIYEHNSNHTEWAFFEVGYNVLLYNPESPYNLLKTVLFDLDLNIHENYDISDLKEIYLEREKNISDTLDKNNIPSLDDIKNNCKAFTKLEKAYCKDTLFEIEPELHSVNQVPYLYVTTTFEESKWDFWKAKYVHPHKILEPIYIFTFDDKTNIKYLGFSAGNPYILKI
ncbi:MAG: hypothetical protein IKP77_05505 [Acholeplasmatales bacterium]|nr:hypothetical protein [Acholeplasmatales bacterium]